MWIVPNEGVQPKLGSHGPTFPRTIPESQMRQDVSTKNRGEGRNLASGDLGRRSLLCPILCRSQEPWSWMQHLQVRLELPYLPGLAQGSSQNYMGLRKRFESCNTLDNNTGIFISELRGKEVMGKLRKRLISAPNAKPYPSLWCCSVSSMTNHPSLPRIFPGLALKIPHPGKLLSPGTTGIAGHLLLLFFVNQINCDPPTRHLRGKGYNNSFHIT